MKSRDWETERAHAEIALLANVTVGMALATWIDTRSTKSLLKMYMAVRTGNLASFVNKDHLISILVWKANDSFRGASSQLLLIRARNTPRVKIELSTEPFPRARKE